MMQGGVYGEKSRRSGAVMSAHRNDQTMGGRPSLNGPSRPSKSMLFPPLGGGETSFSEQYKSYNAQNNNQKRIPMANNLEMSKDLQMRINPMAQNRPYYKRNFRAPPFGANDANSFMASNLIGIPAGLLPSSAEQSVF